MKNLTCKLKAHIRGKIQTSVGDIDWFADSSERRPVQIDFSSCHDSVVYKRGICDSRRNHIASDILRSKLQRCCTV